MSQKSQKKLKIKNLELKDGNKMPILGFGTWQLKGKTAIKTVKHALQLGYRHIDTADLYGNHKAVARGIKGSGINRDEIFITSKVFRKDLKKGRVVAAGKRFLKELELDYLDLLLIHWPKSRIPIENTLEGFFELKKEGLIKSVGVSNFTISHLKEAMKKSEVQISVNQIEYHPSLMQTKLVDFCKKNNIAVTAYSPLGKGKDLKLKVIRELAEKYNKPESQVIINWILSKDIAAIPRSRDFDHIEENLRSLEWDLDEKDIKKIDKKAGSKNNRLINPVFSEF